MNKKYDIVGIGNAIVDTTCLVEEKFLTEHNLTKGGMFLISEADASMLFHLKHDKISPGGSVANSIAALAKLECKTALIGKVGRDKFGDVFFDDLKKINCVFSCKHKGKSGSTAQSFILVTPDGERTMCTYLGLASRIEDEIDENLIKDTKILYIEGYLWDEPKTIAALREAATIAKENNAKVVFSLSDAFCVERHRFDFLGMMENFDIVFANEAEIEVLIGKDFADDNYKKVQEALYHYSPQLTVVMTASQKGAIIFKDQISHHIPTKPVVKVVDTTGAGDAFAAGFLYGMNNNLSIQESASLGNVFAGSVITQVGSRLDKEKLLELIK